jgi:DNA topoisomerase-1
MNNIYLLSRFFLNQQFGGTNKDKKKWSSFIHNGVLFPEPYQSHNIPILYNGIEVKLPELAEEYATLYARYIDSEYIKSKNFNKNFFKCWKPTLKNCSIPIEKLELCDFSNIIKFIEKNKENKKNLDKFEKDRLKELKDKEEEKYKNAIVDGKIQPVGNYRMEPPGIFIGRGCHPKLGMIKKRIFPNDVILNLSKDAPKPELQSFFKNQKWKKIIHDNKSEWLASWKDTITGKTKYVWLGNKSDFKARSDEEKFDRARKLAKIINNIRDKNNINLSSKDKFKAQLATALYFIDKLALRVGNEKSDDEADTVGVTSLRIEHITLKPDNIIKFDFLGKDSIRYVNETVVEEQVYLNVQKFMLNKKSDEDLFDLMNSSDLNEYLKTFMSDLTAKIFRTYNASFLFQQEINDITDKYDKYDKSDKINILLNLFNKANAKVALLCNHQKSVSKNFNESLDKINDKIKDYKKQIIELEELIKNDDSKTNKHKKTIKKLKEYIKSQKNKKDLKLELKNISLGTSKTNYIDPRITVAFLKQHNIPIEKIFSSSLKEKFFWAFDVDQNYKF